MSENDNPNNIEGAHDKDVSSRAKDKLFADAPRTPNEPDKTQDVDATVTDVPERLEVPDEHEHRNYDVKYQSATEDDADFDAPETNAKKDDVEEDHA